MTGISAAGARVVVAVAVATVLTAIHSGPAISAQSDAAPEEESAGILERGHSTASESVRQLGAWLDRLFADENYEAEINKSWARLRLDSFSELYDGTEFDGTARVHLKIPSLNKRLRFEILSPGETDDLEGGDAAQSGADDPSSTGENTSAAVSYIFRALKERSIIFRLGMDFDGYAPNPFAGARYRETIPITDHWNFRFVERLRFYSLDGLESRTSLDFERIFEKDTLFRASLDGTWLQEQPDYFYNVGFALFRPIDDKSAVEYQWINGFKTDPHRLDRITLRIRHRQKVWRDWLAFEVAPQLTFPADREYDPVPGILLRLEATFGG